MLVNVNGRLVPASSVAAADKLIELKKKNQNDIWPVVDELINIWSSLHPIEWKSIIVDIESSRSRRYNDFGSAPDTQGSGDLRRRLDIPEPIEKAIRKLYSVEELPFDKKWYNKLWKRYPDFRISDKS